jgi:hypothetical protein
MSQGARTARRFERYIAICALRRWSVGQERLLGRPYSAFEKVLVAANPVLSFIGCERIKRPVAALSGLRAIAFNRERIIGETVEAGDVVEIGPPLGALRMS